MCSSIKGFLIILAVVLLVMSFIVASFDIGPAPATVEISRETFSESAEALHTPNRGLYSILGFYITDQETDYQGKIDRAFPDDSPINLLMVQINLERYADGEISPQGLLNIRNLFLALRTTQKNLIVRFTYDWDGTVASSEPQSIDIILNHMVQLKGLLQENQDQIFVLQGLFTGNWGEMHGSSYSSQEDLHRLSATLMAVTGESTFLSVRTGAQWRNITTLHQTELMERGNVPRIGLYNDGMLGNSTDCGTYNSSDSRDSDFRAPWSREKELEFQDYLCRYVPNGGEVILNNPLNDFENAVATLKKMHVSYLNYDYDKSVLDKWAAVTVDGGVYDGLDGLSYIERHLGYRILIQDAKVAYNKPRQNLILDLELKNVGFAPLYSEADIILQFLDADGNLVYSYLFDQDIRQLYGGMDSSNPMELHHEISLADWPLGDFTVYLSIRDKATGEPLVLANEQSMTQHGYKIAGIRRS